MALSAGAVAGIVIGSLFGFVLLVFLLLVALRFWMRGPTRGSDNPKQLHGKTIVITGANTGIGKVAATDLARRGAKVIICCRSLERAEAAVKDIKDDSGSNLVEIQQLDLASLKSVRQCAEALLEKEEKIDYLINNAGVMLCPDWKTEDGFDMQMGTNHLGHFLLTELVMPLIKKSAASGHHPRIVIVSSLAHVGARDGIDFDDIHFEKNFSSMKAYQQSKLANVLHAKELARRLDNTGISVYALHPGVIMTELGRHIEEKIPKAVGCCLKPTSKFVCKTPFYGAQTTLYCVLEDKIEAESGCYYSDCHVKTPAAQAQDMEAAKRLWELSEELVGLKK